MLMLSSGSPLRSHSIMLKWPSLAIPNLLGTLMCLQWVSVACPSHQSPFGFLLSLYMAYDHSFLFSGLANLPFSGRRPPVGIPVM